MPVLTCGEFSTRTLRPHLKLAERRRNGQHTHATRENPSFTRSIKVLLIIHTHSRASHFSLLASQT